VTSMHNIPPDPELEQRISTLLSAQPQRHAPASLQRRVLTAISQRRAAPWWQRSFPQWPLAARLAFLTASFGVAVLAILATPLLRHSVQPRLTWMPAVLQLARTAYDTSAVVLHAIPQTWIEVAAAFAALLYLATFALGATAYRALYSRT
jgi:hypothetical protein